VAERSIQSPEPGSIAVWTFVIRDGQTFDLVLNEKLGPPLNHDGLLTIWKMVGTKSEADSVLEMVTGPLIGARVVRHTEVETEEMLAIRHERLGLATEKT